MTDNVIISIKGKQLYTDSGPDEMELVTAGVLRQDWTGTTADNDPLGGFTSVEDLRAALWTPGMEL